MGEITKQELMQGLTNIFLVQYSERDVDLFIARFNKDGRGTLKYSEFYNAIKPKSQSVLNELESRQPRNLRMRISYDDLFADNTKELFCQIWEAMFESES
jgi:hypothetical protein